MKNNLSSLKEIPKETFDEMAKDPFFSEFFIEWDEMSDGDKNTQKEELLRRYSNPEGEKLLEIILGGEDCDKVSNSFGNFGTSPTNPIPVNGVIGEFKYLNRIRFNNQRFIYHRLGNLEVEELNGLIVDVYEIVTMDGKHWDTLYFDYYHPRRSTMVPDGYAYSDDKGLPFLDLMLNLCTIGTNSKVDSFPFNMEDKILERNRSDTLREISLNLYKESTQEKENFTRKNNTIKERSFDFTKEEKETVQMYFDLFRE